MELDWHDTEEIGIQLFEKYPDKNPLEVRFTDLRQWVCELEEFRGDPGKSNEKILETIQMAWLENWQEENE